MQLLLWYVLVMTQSKISTYRPNAAHSIPVKQVFAAFPLLAMQLPLAISLLLHHSTRNAKTTEHNVALK